jgi:DNA-binding MurR/RpiR family transcriptional regulator
MRPGEAKIAKLILDAPDDVIYWSVTELAERAGTSTATVVRCAQGIGLRGFHELKLGLARQAGTRATLSPDGGSPGAVLAAVSAASAQAAQEAPSLISSADFENAVAAIAGAPRLLVAGVGTSAALASDAAYRLTIIGCNADAPRDAHTQHVVAASLRAEDVCLIVSHTGSTRETLAVMTAAKNAGAHTIALTSYVRSPLTDLADISLVAGSPEMSFRLEAMSSRVAHMVVLDAVVVAVAEAQPDRTQAALDRYANVLTDHRL